MGKHSAWRTWNSTRPRTIPAPNNQIAVDTHEDVLAHSDNTICPQCNKVLSGRIIETLAGDRVHTDCYTKGGQR